jgi:hypothetical protein
MNSIVELAYVQKFNLHIEPITNSDANEQRTVILLMEKKWKSYGNYSLWFPVIFFLCGYLNSYFNEVDYGKRIAKRSI